MGWGLVTGRLKIGNEIYEILKGGGETMDLPGGGTLFGERLCVSVGQYSVPLLHKLLIMLAWRTPLGSAKDFSNLSLLAKSKWSASPTFLQQPDSIEKIFARVVHGSSRNNPKNSTITMKGFRAYPAQVTKVFARTETTNCSPELFVVQAGCMWRQQEQMTLNQRVPSSSPGAPTKFIKYLARDFSIFFGLSIIWAT
jgi:hypothetical protein